MVLADETSLFDDVDDDAAVEDMIRHRLHSENSSRVIREARVIKSRPCQRLPAGLG